MTPSYDVNLFSVRSLGQYVAPDHCLLDCVLFYAYYLSDGLCTYDFLPGSQIRIKLFLMLVFLFVLISVWINNRAVIRIKGNINIKNKLIRICDTDKSRTYKVRRINNTHKRKQSLNSVSVLVSLFQYRHVFSLTITGNGKNSPYHIKTKFWSYIMKTCTR